MNFFTIYNFIRIRLESVVITVVALDKLCETMQSQEVSENHFGSKAALLIYKFIIIFYFNSLYKTGMFYFLKNDITLFVANFCFGSVVQLSQ